MKEPKIIVAINYVNYGNKKKQDHQEMALRVLASNRPSNVELVSFNYINENVFPPPCFKVFKMLKRNSRATIHNNRDLPYIKDIFNLCSEMKSDVFGYMNSDILVNRDFFNGMHVNRDAFLFQRIDIKSIADASSFNKGHYKVYMKDHPGFDAIFFNRIWWRKNSNKFDGGLIVGEPEWDFYYVKKIRSLSRNFKIKRALYHVFHKTIWTLNSTGSINNRKINGTIP